MRKTFLIGLKDLRVAFRDRAALILMLAAPFLLTLGLGLVTGQFSGSSSGISDIPVVIVNQDQAELGKALVDVFNSQELASLLEPSKAASIEAARALVDEDKAAAAVIIPAGFTRSIIPAQGGFTNPNTLNAEPVKIQVYRNPTRPTSAGVVEGIVDEFLSRVEEGRLSGMTAILQLLQSGRISMGQAEEAGTAMGERLQNQPAEAGSGIQLVTLESGEAAVDFNPLAYIAPGMALMFLMFTVSNGGRSILAERAQGTLPRLIVSPTRPAQILGGKVFGIFLTGTVQMLILIGGSSLLFQLRWGDPLGVLVLVLAAVFAATGWGMLITALAPTPNQATNIGSALMLIFGILGGSFINLEQLPAFVRVISKITPNAWALDGFSILGGGGILADLLVPISGLLILGAALFSASTLLFGRKNLAAA
jgi:ABC-2 type transport system permease protein